MQGEARLDETVAVFLWELAGVTTFCQLVSEDIPPFAINKEVCSLPKGVNLGGREKGGLNVHRSSRKNLFKSMEEESAGHVWDYFPIIL